MVVAVRRGPVCQTIGLGDGRPIDCNMAYVIGDSPERVARHAPFRTYTGTASLLPFKVNERRSG